MWSALRPFLSGSGNLFAGPQREPGSEEQLADATACPKKGASRRASLRSSSSVIREKILSRASGAAPLEGRLRLQEKESLESVPFSHRDQCNSLVLSKALHEQHHGQALHSRLPPETPKKYNDEDLHSTAITAGHAAHAELSGAQRTAGALADDQKIIIQGHGKAVDSFALRKKSEGTDSCVSSHVTAPYSSFHMSRKWSSRDRRISHHTAGFDGKDYEARTLGRQHTRTSRFYHRFMLGSRGSRNNPGSAEPRASSNKTAPSSRQESNASSWLFRNSDKELVLQSETGQSHHRQITKGAFRQHKQHTTTTRSSVSTAIMTPTATSSDVEHEKLAETRIALTKGHQVKLQTGSRQRDPSKRTPRSSFEEHHLCNGRNGSLDPTRSQSSIGNSFRRFLWWCFSDSSSSLHRSQSTHIGLRSRTLRPAATTNSQPTITSRREDTMSRSCCSVKATAEPLARSRGLPCLVLPKKDARSRCLAKSPKTLLTAETSYCPRKRVDGSFGMRPVSDASTESTGEDSPCDENHSHCYPSAVVSFRPPPPTAQKRLQLADLEFGRTLGTGTSGRVRLGRLKNHPAGPPVVVKIIRKASFLRIKQVEHAVSEKRLLQRIHHPFIVSYLGAFQSPEYLFVVMEFVPGGELFSYTRKMGRLDNGCTRFYAAELLTALDYLHSRNIVYRDLKPENVLIDATGHIKLADFGFAKHVPDRTWTLCGTPEYLAPETIQYKGHAASVDWWALGILIYELLVGHPPFQSKSPSRLTEKILLGDICFPPFIDKDAKDLITQLLKADRTKRLGCLKGGVDDIRRHKWFSTLDWDQCARRALLPPFIPKLASRHDTSMFGGYPETSLHDSDSTARSLPVGAHDLLKEFDLNY